MIGRNAHMHIAENVQLAVAQGYTDTQLTLVQSTAR